MYRWNFEGGSTTIAARIRLATRRMRGETGRRLFAHGCRGGAASVRAEESMKPTDISTPDYFHKVVDCQWACPAHTPVPEYIRLIAAGRYSDAYMVNWKSNVFPG